MRDRAFFTVVMAVCAISGARLRDGAGMEALGVTPARRAPDSESFYSAANRAFPADLSQATEFDYKRAKVLLAMLWIQYGHPPRVAANLGDYMTMCSIDSFHSEARWPPGLTVAEVQERRRLFWGAYTVDIYTATTWNFPVRHRELQCTVVYPAAVDDEDITDMGIVSGRLSWMEGWLFTNDLYRVLEHTLDQLRQRRLPIDTSRVTALWHDRSRPSAEEVLAVVDKLYERLSPEFKQAKSVTGDIRLDRFGFQGELTCLWVI
jgi:hypothetical protein